MLRRNISHEARREEIALAKSRAMADQGTVGPHFLLLEPEVRARVSKLLASVALVRAVRHSIWLSPQSCSALIARVFSRPTAYGLICIGADAAQTAVSCRFDDEEPKIRLDSVCLVNAIRPTEQHNLSLVYLGATLAESKEAIERVIQECRLEETFTPLRLTPYLLVDAGGILKWFKRRKACALDGIAKAHVAVDVMTTLQPRCLATAQSLGLGVNIAPSHLVVGLLHGLCTVVWRMYKCGLTRAEQDTLDAWFEGVTGRRLRGRTAKASGDDGEADRKTGKLEIERLDAALARFPDLLGHLPERWHEVMRCVRRLRTRRMDSRGLRVLVIVHQRFIENTENGWSLGCHFLAHTIDFACRYACGDLWVVHEQLVERANQLFKQKTRFWSGDAARALAAHNCQHL